MRRNVFLLLLVAFIGCYSTLVQADRTAGMITTDLARTPTGRSRGLRGSAELRETTTDAEAEEEEEARWLKIPKLSKLKNLFRKNPTSTVNTLRKDPKIVKQVETLQKNPQVMKEVENVKEIPAVQKNLNRLQSNPEKMATLRNGAPETSIREASSFLSRGMSADSKAKWKIGLAFLGFLVMFGTVIGVASLVSGTGKK